ncbi:MAG: hypothetical protein AAGJ85_05730 [Pseudomonadota bacterium]
MRTGKQTVWAIVIVFSMVFGLATALFWVPIGTKFAGLSVTSWNIPDDLELKRMTAYGPGCDMFSCMGGSIYELSPETSRRIQKEGLGYLNSLRVLPRGLELDRGWVKCAPLNNGQASSEDEDSQCIRHLLIGSPDLGDFESFKQAMRTEPRYVGLRSGQEPYLIVLPESGLIYQGWID